MMYPKPEQVEKASQMKLGRWLRFLDSPGMSAIQEGLTGDALEVRRLEESKVMDRIRERFDGWTPQLSKAIGW